MRTELAERPRADFYQPRAAYPEAHGYRQSFHHPRTSLGAAGHWIHLLSVAAPLVIASEALWTHRLSKERQKDEESHAALESCHDRCR
jgi:hypothetical protein